VNFIISGNVGSRRRRQSENNQQQRKRNRISASDTQLYRDLAQASGGLVIEVGKSELLTATSIIRDSFNTPQVTLLQAARSPGNAENFTFTVDESVRNLTIYLTGSSFNFTLISPTGVSVSSNNLIGSLVITSQSVGNFQTLQLKVQVGMWKVQMMSTSSYTLKVVARSSIDFLFDFLEVSQGPLGGFYVLENCPRAGVNGSVRVTVIGNDSATVTEVTLVESSGSGQVNGNVNPQGGGVFFVHFDRIPSVEFVVLIKGFPPTLSLDSAGSANGTVTLTAPSGTPSGTDVTLTIEATAPGIGDTNYVVLLFTVLTTVTDFTPPVCQRLSPASKCSTNCNSMWELSVQVNDGPEGMGIEHVSLRQGSGTMSTSLAPENKNITLVSYKASCCSPDVEMVVADRAGNVGSCLYSTPVTTTSQPPTAAPAPSSSTKAAQSFLLCLSVMILGLSLPSEICIN
ncbi:hypothetical protein INR49_011345, partial [Caranx melampygus]